MNLKRQLYIWRLCLIKDVINIECIQRKATKSVLNDYSSEYKSRLESLHILTLTLWFKLQDIMLLPRRLHDPSDTMAININRYVSFVSSNVRASTFNKPKHNFRTTSKARHFYFSHVIRLWNSLPVHLRILSLSSTTVNFCIQNFSGLIFSMISTQITLTHLTYLLCTCSQCYLS